MNRVVHFEIVAKDFEKVSAFYSKAFGWKFEKWNGPMEYWFIRTGDPQKEGIDGGLGRRTAEDEGTINTIDVEDIDETIKKIQKNGGQIIRPKGPIPGIGWLAYFKDPEGTMWGVMQSDPNAK